MIQQERFIDQLHDHGPLFENIESGQIQSWPQRAPRRFGMLTFDHTSRLELIDGVVTPMLSATGCDFSYTTEQSFDGLWVRRWKPKAATAKPCNQLIIGDSRPGEMILLADGEEIQNPLEPLRLVQAIKLAFLNMAEKGETLALELNRPT